MTWHLLHSWKKTGKPYLEVRRETEYAKLYSGRQDWQCALCGKERTTDAWTTHYPLEFSGEWILNYEAEKGEVKFDPVIGVFVLPPMPPTPGRRPVE